MIGNIPTNLKNKQTATYLVLVLEIAGLETSFWRLFVPYISPQRFAKLYRSTALVYVSLDDYRRPLDKVSTTQSATLAATGLIWTRYCLIIRPINYSLSLCNFLLGVANSVQCYRAYSYQKNLAEVASDETNTDKEGGVPMVLPKSEQKS